MIDADFPHFTLKSVEVWPNLPYHNTGASFIHNRTNSTLYIEDGENEHYREFIDPMNERSFRNVQLPWCNNDDEIRDKAFRFYKYDGGTLYTPLFYMYQNYGNDTVYWTAWNGGTPVFDAGVSAGASPSPYVDIIVEAVGNNITPRTIGF